MAASIEIATLCRLARLPEPASAQEHQKLIADLGQILEFFATIQIVDTTNVEPLFVPVEELLSLAPSESICESISESAGRQTGQSLSKEQVLAQAPETDGEYFLVPRVLP